MNTNYIKHYKIMSREDTYTHRHNTCAHVCVCVVTKLRPG